MLSPTPVRVRRHIVLPIAPVGPAQIVSNLVNVTPPTIEPDLFETLQVFLSRSEYVHEVCKIEL